MKSPPKLRKYISISLVGIILVMIVAYSILVVYALFSTLMEAASYDYNLIARDFAQAYRKDAATALPSTKYYTAYLDSREIPAWIKKEVDFESLVHSQLEVGFAINPSIQNGEEVIYFVMAYDLHDQKRLYLIEIHSEEDEIPGTFKNFKRALIIALGLGIGFIVLVGFTLRYFFHKISTPISALTTWAHDLNREKLEQPHPDFKFEEINQLADLIQNAVGELHRAMNREHHFLRNASHELRTPIAVIRTNMDLLDRLQSDPKGKEKLSYRRIRRAVENMNRLTETLLWLGRKSETMPSPESINVNAMVEELVQENRYLLKGKDVNIEMEMVSATVTLPKAALHIVLGNLVRNAFQYTNQGRIEIQVTQTAVTIINTDLTQKKTNSTGSDYGFGFGLMLVEQISQKLNLPYENKTIMGGHKAILYLSHSD